LITAQSHQVFRYQGLSLTTLFDHTGSTGPTLPKWYVVSSSDSGAKRDDGVGRGGGSGGGHGVAADDMHYLRQAYANPSTLWKLKREVELRAFQWAVSGLWHIQTKLEVHLKSFLAFATHTTAV